MDLGCDYIEIDLRTAPDGRLLIKHDPLAPGDNVPTFDDVLALAKGRIRIYLDVKQAMPAAIVAAVEKAGMRDSILTYAGANLLKDLVTLRPGWPCLPEAVSPENLAARLAELKPPAVAISSRAIRADLTAIARKAGCGVLVDCQGPDDNPGRWQPVIDSGATGLQTDRPTALLAWLRRQNLHA
jgi:glycerophosphoryl diester phosphodiesterase